MLTLFKPLTIVLIIYHPYYVLLSDMCCLSNYYYNYEFEKRQVNIYLRPYEIWRRPSPMAVPTSRIPLSPSVVGYAHTTDLILTKFQNQDIINVDQATLKYQ